MNEAIIVPEDIKWEIAEVVRSVNLYIGSPGGLCCFRMVTGYVVLRILKIPAGLVLGGMAYQAGPDPVRDVVGFCGRDWYGCVCDQGILAHYWLLVGNDFVDFSVGDWKRVSAAERAHYYPPGTPQMDPVEWTAPELPAFFWADKNTFATKGASPLKLGQTWYTGFKGNPPNGDTIMAEYLPRVKVFLPALVKQCEARHLKKLLASRL
jgi:hypothetical protein